MSDPRSRRKWLRCAVRFRVGLQVLDPGNKKIWSGDGSTVNIGGGGALLEIQGLEEKLIENLIAEKYVLQLALELPRLSVKAKIRAKVLWAEEFQKQRVGFKTFGIEFKGLPKKTEDKIINYVEDRVATEIAESALKTSCPCRKTRHKKKVGS